MKKRVVIIIILLIIIFAGTTNTPDTVFAAPYGTLTMGPGGTLVATQTAYEPLELFDIRFKKSESMYYEQLSQLVYVSDSSEQKIYVLDTHGELVTQINYPDFIQPIGITSNKDYIYVADRGAKAIFAFYSLTYDYAFTINRPESSLFGSTSPFVPVKIAATDSSLYIVSEGSTKGLIQMTIKGDFLGYTCANKTSAGILNFFQQLLFSSEQKDALINAAPPSPNNLAISSQGLLFTVTKGEQAAPIKKLNTLGNIIMTPSYARPLTVAVAVDKDDNIFSVGSDGMITVYDCFGDLLFTFGSGSDSRLGSLPSPSAISVLEDNDILVLDTKLNAIVKYTQTSFAELVFSAVSYYRDGLYVEGEQLWEEILMLNSSFILPYKALAASNMKKNNYSLALEQYKLAEDKAGYSESFWNIRREWIQNNTIYVILFVLVIACIIIALRQIYYRTTKLDKAVSTYKTIINKPVISSLLLIKAYSVNVTDTLFEIKYNKKSNIPSATILYGLFILIQILGIVFTGYLFSNSNIYNTNLLELILFSVVPLFLWIICNYFVSTVSDGEGSFKDIYICTIYAFAPVLMLSIPIFALTNILAFNEMIIYQIVNIIMYGWTFILLFLTYQQVHDYTFWQTVKNILLTAVTFVLSLLAVVILYMLVSQLFGYTSSVITEVINNVFK